MFARAMLQVGNGSTLRVTLLEDLQYATVQVHPLFTLRVAIQIGYSVPRSTDKCIKFWEPHEIARQYTKTL